MRVSGVTVRKRLAIVLFVGFIVFLIIDTRLGYVQLLTGDTLTEKPKTYGVGIFLLNLKEERY